MRVAILVALFVVAGSTRASAYQRFISPNGRFEAYTTANAPNGTGMKILLRAAGSRDEGTLLWKNNRWLDARWSPDSRFLAIIDHLDGHIADVYVSVSALITQLGHLSRRFFTTRPSCGGMTFSGTL